jgi:ATP-binding cassette subfamily B protein
VSDRDEVLGKAYDGRLMRRLATFVRPYRGLVALTLLTLFAGSAVQLVQPYLVKEVIDGFIVARRTEGLALPVALFLTTLILDFVLGFFQIYFLERTGQNVVFDLRNAVFAHLQRLPSSFFDRTPVGRLMTRVTTDVESINEAFTSGVVLILADVAKLLGIVVILVAMDVRLALVTFAVIPPMLLVSWWFRVRVRDAYRTMRSAVAKLNATLQESVSGMRIIQLFRREELAAGDFHAQNDEHRAAQLGGVFYESAFSAAAELMGSVTLAAIVWAGGRRLLGGAITFGTLVAFFEYAGRFFRPVQELSQRYTVMQAAMASAERVFALLDTPSSLSSPADAYVPPARPKGEIVFENVTFGYAGGPPVLKNVSFRVTPGERLAVVGWTGAGKSTLIRLLARLYDVQEGRILLDGVDVRAYDLRALRRTHRRREHRHGRPGDRPGNDPEERTRRPRRPVHRETAGRIRRAGPGAGLELLGRREAASVVRSGAGVRSGRARARRGHRFGRPRDRGSHPGRPQGATDRTHLGHHRPPAPDDQRRRSHPRPPPRRGARVGASRRAVGARR